MPVPTFLVAPDVNIEVNLEFLCLANFKVAIADLDEASKTWVPRSPYLENGRLSHDSATYTIPAVATGVTILLVVMLSMTSLGGASPVSTAVRILQSGAPRGEVDTPAASPGPDQAAMVNVQLFLRGAPV